MTSKGLVALVLGFAASAAMGQQFLPDPERTPGAINNYVTQDNLKSTACSARWTRWVAPSSAYTSRLKAQQIEELGLPGDGRQYVEDHLVPLCAGGHPRDPRNLWPQPVRGKWSAAVKERLEISVCRAVCRGDLTLEDGRAIFLRPDWTQEYVRFFKLK